MTIPTDLDANMPAMGLTRYQLSVVLNNLKLAYLRGQHDAIRDEQSFYSDTNKRLDRENGQV